MELQFGMHTFFIWFYSMRMKTVIFHDIQITENRFWKKNPFWMNSNKNNWSFKLQKIRKNQQFDIKKKKRKEQPQDLVNNVKIKIRWKYSRLRALQARKRFKLVCKMESCISHRLVSFKFQTKTEPKDEQSKLRYLTQAQNYQHVAILCAFSRIVTTNPSRKSHWMRISRLEQRTVELWIANRWVADYIEQRSRSRFIRHQNENWTTLRIECNEPSRQKAIR